MIELSYPSKRPKPVYQPYFTPHEIAQAQSKKVTPAVYKVRDDIIRKLALECKLFINDTFYPIDKKEYEKHGACRVTHVCWTYKDLGNDEWPKNNNPFIISAVSANGYNFVCTSNYGSKNNEHLAISC